jgi:hypothetical protein
VEPQLAIEPVRAPDSPAAPVDPTEEDLARFARSCPPGVIEGIVLRGKVPVGGGAAWLGAEKSGGLPWGAADLWDSAPGVRRTIIGADGIFRFEDLPPEDYDVGVRTRDATTRRVVVGLKADTPTERVRIVLGAGGIRGHVYDDQGIVCSAWEIALYNFGNTLAGTQVIARGFTDPSGAFEFGGLVGGNYVLRASADLKWRGQSTHTRYVVLRAGEWKSVDMGAPQHGALWTGRVLLPRGEPLALDELTQLRVQSDGVIEEVPVSPSGGFRMRGAVGVHRLELMVYSDAGAVIVALGEITLAEGSLERDIHLPRAVLRVRADYQGNSTGPRSEFSMLLVPVESRESFRNVGGSRGADGNMYFLGLAPGKYTLSCSSPIQGAPGGRLPVTIGASDDESELDVVVGDR